MTTLIALLLGMLVTGVGVAFGIVAHDRARDWQQPAAQGPREQ